MNTWPRTNTPRKAAGLVAADFERNYSLGALSEMQASDVAPAPAECSSYLLADPPESGDGIQRGVFWWGLIWPLALVIIGGLAVWLIRGGAVGLIPLAGLA